MRKSFLLLLFFTLLYGCSTETAKQDTETLYKQFPYLNPIKEAEQIEIRPNSLLTDQTSYDMDGDGVEEQVEMYVYPPPIKSEREGEPVEWGWDDSHHWQLIVRDGEEIYPLYNYGPHFTMFKFWIFDDRVNPEIILMLDSPFGITMYSYSFDKEKKHYKQTVIYSNEGQREYFSRFPR